MKRRQLGSERIIEVIEEEWVKTRPPVGVGSTDSGVVYGRLAAEGVDVPRRALARALEALWDEGFVEGAPHPARSDVPTRGGARPIIEPKWHADLRRKKSEGK